MRTLYAIVLAAALPGCGISIQELASVVREARACTDGDTCVLAGGSQCTCNTAVNSTKKKDVDIAVASVDCGGAMVECAECLDPQCVQGMCSCAKR
ncbi:MAG: hypothetical protein QM765_02000 [Myxococcales bacterium]